MNEFVGLYFALLISIGFNAILSWRCHRLMMSMKNNVTYHERLKR